MRTQLPTTGTTRARTRTSFPNGLWAVVRAFLLSSLITLAGAGIWNALLFANLKVGPAIPWSVVVMAGVLWLLWRYLDGAWWPRRTASARHSLLRATLVSRRMFGWAWLAGGLALVALVGVWIVLVELTGAGGNPTLSTYAAYPPLTVTLALLMGSVVSPLTEEAAYRGYAQVILERVFPAMAAVTLSSIFFALWHGPTQGFLWPKLLFYFLVGLTFGATAYLTNSILPAILVHMAGDLTFFFLIWPHDATRPSVRQVGPDVSFWLAVAQAIIFTALAILAFSRLARLSRVATQPDRDAPAPA